MLKSGRSKVGKDVWNDEGDTV